MGETKKKATGAKAKTDKPKAKATKATTDKPKAKKKRADEADIKRGANGQFQPGQSGNPGGRPKLSEDFKEYAQKAPEELWKLATRADVGNTIKKDILIWFSEMYYGKPKQQIDGEINGNIGGLRVIKLEGELDEWAQ